MDEEKWLNYNRRMDLKGRILQTVRPRRDGVLLRADVNALGSTSRVSAALRALCEHGALERLERGIYAQPAKVAALGRAELLERARTRMLRARSKAKRHKRRVENRRDTSIARHVRQLAREAGVVHVDTFGDQWAAAVTRLSGDEVQTDATDDLLVALARAGKLSPREMVKLVMAHHRARKSHV